MGFQSIPIKHKTQLLVMYQKNANSDWKYELDSRSGF